MQEENYTITEAYQYPVVPGMPEWAAFNSLDEMIAACEIPDDVLEAMSTYALIETVMNYPLNINVIAFNTPKQGFDSVASYCNGIKELMNREDTLAKMDAYISKRDGGTSNSVNGIIISGIYGRWQLF